MTVFVIFINKLAVKAWASLAQQQEERGVGWAKLGDDVEQSLVSTGMQDKRAFPSSERSNARLIIILSWLLTQLY